MGKIALITGITGQDGSYLVEYLCAKERRYRIIEKYFLDYKSSESIRRR